MVRVVVVGLGPIGVAAARAVSVDPRMTLAWRVDIDQAKVGRTVAESRSGLVVLRSMRETGGADVALVTTTSKLDRMAGTLREAMGLGVRVVSSCEEMSWPWYRHAELAKEL